MKWQPPLLKNHFLGPQSITVMVFSLAARLTRSSRPSFSFPLSTTPFLLLPEPSFANQRSCRRYRSDRGRSIGSRWTQNYATPGALVNQRTHAVQTKGLKIMGALCSAGGLYRNPSSLLLARVVSARGTP